MTSKKFKFERPVKNHQLGSDDGPIENRIGHRLTKNLKAKNVFVVLNDGETYSRLDGCKIVFLDPEEAHPDDIEVNLKVNYRDEADTIDVSDVLHYWKDDV